MEVQLRCTPGLCCKETLKRECIRRRLSFRRSFRFRFESSRRLLMIRPLPHLQQASPETIHPTSSPDSTELDAFDQALETIDLDQCWTVLCKVRDSVDGVQWLLRSLLGQRPKLFIQKCVETGRYDLVFLHLRAFPQTARSFSFLLSASLRLGHYSRVLELIDLRREIGLQPDSYSYNTHISALSKLGRLVEAQQVFQEAKSTQNDSIYVYNTMLDAFARVGALERAIEVWDWIEEAGLQPDSVSYVGIMRAWSRQGNMEKVLLLFDEMSSRDFQPDPHAFTIVLDCVFKTSYPIGGGWLKAFVQSMVSKEILMNRHILGAMINAFSRQKLNIEHIHFVFQTIQEFRQKSSSLGNEVFGSWIDFCARARIPETVLEVWRIYKQEKKTPNSHIYTLLLKACCLMEKTNKVHQLVEELTHLMKLDWEKKKKRSDHEEVLRPAFNSLLKFYGELKDGGKVWEIYQFMLKEGPFPNLITFNTVMAASHSCGLHDQTEEVLTKMKEIGQDLNEKSYGILLNACSNIGDVERAISLWEEMKESEVKPTVECYTSLINTCIKEGSPVNIQLAFSYFNEMKSQDLRPTAVTYGCMLHAFKAQGDVDGAFHLYQEACGVGVSPSDECHNILINMCTMAGRLEDGLELIKVLVRKHGNIAEDTMNSIIRALASNYLGRSLVLLRLMDNRGLKPDWSTFDSLVLACCRESEIRKGFSLYKEMISRRIPIRQEVGSALIQSLSIAGEIQAALIVTNYMFEKAGLRSIDTPSMKKGLIDNEAPSTKRKERIMYASIPSSISLGYLAATLARMKEIDSALYIFRQIYNIEHVSGMVCLAEEVPQVFEALIELCCRGRQLSWAMEVFHKWKEATKEIIKRNGDACYPRISLATLAFLLGTCSRTQGYERFVDDICQTMQLQRLQTRKYPARSTHHKQHKTNLM